jgi:beta-glucosidase
MTTPHVARLTELLAQLTLEEKVGLVSGADFWTTTPIERIGLRAMVLSDGPSGVRGPVWDERSPSLNLPSATALASSWDPSLARRFGEVSASEARRKVVDVVLGPTINLHRSPLGGRHFEAFSEDPLLSGILGAAYVEGVQSHGVAATPKHYVANDSETDRFTVDVHVAERALRELYLLPFEYTVEAGAWAIMSSYNSIDGVTLTENDLLEAPLNSEWGFDGVVVSDWTAVRSLASASAAHDLAMPGPAPAWGDLLVAAVRAGEVPEADIDRKVLRMLALAERVGALAGSEPQAIPPIDGIAFAREAAAEGAVLVRNENELPWDAATLSRVAVIGHNAREARTQGGGSATVIPERIVSPLDGIRAALPGAHVDYALGAIVQEGLAEFPLPTMRNPNTGEPGLVTEFLDADGTVIFNEDRRSSALVWFGGTAPIAEASIIRFRTVLVPERDETVRLGFASAVRGCVSLDGVVVIDENPVVEGTDLGAAFLSPPSATIPVELRVGSEHLVEVDSHLVKTGSGLDGAFSATLGVAPPESDAAALIAEAVELASNAEVVVVVVGTNSRVESEGYDRSDLNLPGEQDALVRAVAAVNPRTVVVVNAGAPVLLPWRNEVAAIVLGYFGGQEFGSAIADVVFGAAEPGGRLTTTWPAALADVPVLDVTPTDGVLSYDEGIHIGYRAWLKAGTVPAYPFGFGLGYTTWNLASAELVASFVEGNAELEVVVNNTGDRSGKHVVQVYAARADSAIDRPVRWLVGSAVVRADGGEAVAVRVPLRARSFAHWEGGRDGAWATEPGEFTLHVGSSVNDLPLTVTVDLG